MQGYFVISKLDSFFQFHSEALGVRAQRQALIAGNIANADTPNYKARDIDFKAALTDAMAGRGMGGTAMARTSAGHMTGSPMNSMAGTQHMQFRTVMQPSVDGNTVDMDVERAAFADNAVRYEAGLTFVNGRLRGLLDAMQPAR